MRIIAIADTQAQHGKIRLSEIPTGDVFVVAGDFCGWGTVEEAESFNEWLKQLPHKHKIVVAGNHELVFEEIEGQLLFTNATYLEDSGIEIDGVKFWGSPINNTAIVSNFKAFHDNQVERANKIPADTDVLITHGPAYKTLDRVLNGDMVGSLPLRERIYEIEPKVSIFGHIHEDYGETTVRALKTKFVNAALCNLWNDIVDSTGKLLKPPITIDL